MCEEIAAFSFFRSSSRRSCHRPSSTHVTPKTTTIANAASHRFEYRNRYMRAETLPVFVALRDGLPKTFRPGGPNGIRTRVSTLRGSHPWPLDDGTAGAPGFEPGLPEPESGALPGYATPQRPAMVLGACRGGKDFSFCGVRSLQRYEAAGPRARDRGSRSTRKG